MEKKQLLFALKRYIFFLCNTRSGAFFFYIIMSSLFFLFYLITIISKHTEYIWSNKTEPLILISYLFAYLLQFYVYINENLLFYNALSSSFAAILPMKCLHICIKSWFYLWNNLSYCFFRTNVIWKINNYYLH